MSTSGTDTLGPFITNRFGDRYLYEVNRNVFNQVGSAALYKTDYLPQFQSFGFLHIIVGSDSGVLVPWLEKFANSYNSRFLIVELPEVLERLRDDGLLDQVSDFIKVVSLDELTVAAKDFNFESYVYLDAAKVRFSYAALDGFLHEYVDLAGQVLAWFKQAVYQVSTLIGTAGFILSQLENLAENRLRANCIKGVFHGKTAVVLGGGPSLDEILPWVCEHRDQLIILAVSRISRQLLAAGLMPHFVISIDPQDIGFEVSREMLRMQENAIFIHAYHVSSKLLSQWGGRSLYMGDLFPWPSILNAENLPACGPTVTNAALEVAMVMECSQIVFGGVDLCFGGLGETHASGSNESLMGLQLRVTGLHKVQTNGGWMAETNNGFRHAMEILSQQAGGARQRGLRVINPAAAAARMDHVEHLSLAEINLDGQHHGSPVEKVLGLLPDENAESRLRHYRNVADELGHARVCMEKIKELASEALSCNNSLFGRNGKKPDFKFKRRMDEIEKRLNCEFSQFIPLVKQFGLRSFVKTARPDDAATWTNEEIERIARLYYEAYRDSAAELLSHLEKSLQRVVSRIEEEGRKPDLQRLAAQWRADNQPGRARVWIRRNSDLLMSLPSSDRKVLDELAAEFEQQMTVCETRQVKLIKEYRSLKGINAKALYLFKRKDSEGLQALLQGLAKYQEQGDAEPLVHLVQGYLNELSGDQESALCHYQQILGENFEPITEDVLKRIAIISLETGQTEFALMALECLARGAVIHKPKYGGLLQALGRLQDAADVYVDYLEAVPSDLTVLLKLGQLYRTLGAEDAARQVFLMVLEQDPQNEAAQVLLREG